MLYGALLDVLSEQHEAVGRHVHDSPIGSLHHGGLQGPFGHSDRPHHKRLHPGETYRLTLGIVDPADQPLFEALIESLVFTRQTLPLSDGRVLAVESFESRRATPRELETRAAEASISAIEMQFETATCIREAGEVTTMFPHRVAVFRSLAARWHHVTPEDMQLPLTTEDLLRHVIEKPDTSSLQTHSVLVGWIEPDDGDARPLFRQGFTGTCQYAFKGAEESTVESVATLAAFGTYGGVGTAVARGCGHVQVDIQTGGEDA